MCRIQLKPQIMIKDNQIVGRFSIDVKYLGARNRNILKAAAVDCVLCSGKDETHQSIPLGNIISLHIKKGVLIFQ